MIIDCLGSGSTGNSYILEFNSGDVIVLDAGVPYKEIKKALGMRRTKLRGVFITHEHGDHSKAVKDMIKDGVHIYTSSGTAEALGISEAIRVHIIRAGEAVLLNHIKVIPYEAKHNAKEPFLFTVNDKHTKESLVFITDSAYVDYVFNKFNYYLLECNYISEIAKEMRSKGLYSHSEAHMSLANLVTMLERTNLEKCQQIVLLHLSGNNADEKQMIKTISELTKKPVDVAYKGKRWELSPSPF